jgi:hypothetical protein
MSEAIYETESLCPICLRKIPARYEECGGRIYLTKTCPNTAAFACCSGGTRTCTAAGAGRRYTPRARDCGPEEKRDALWTAEYVPGTAAESARR